MKWIRFCLLLHLALPVAAMGQKNPAQVPLEFVQFLLSPPFEFANAPDIYLAQLPPQLNSFPLPKHARVIGSIDHHPRIVSAVIAPGDPSSVTGFVRSRLLEQGWSLNQGDRGSMGGFATNESSAGMSFCNPDSSMLHVRVVPEGSDKSRLIISASGRTSYSPCGAHAFRSDPRQSVLPVLKAMPNSSVSPRSSGGGTNESHSNGYLQTTADLSTVTSYYVAQLQAAGWTPISNAKTPGVETHVFEFKDKEGERWDALLVTSKTSSARWPYLLTLRALRPVESMGF